MIKRGWVGCWVGGGDRCRFVKVIVIVIGE